MKLTNPIHENYTITISAIANETGASNNTIASADSRDTPINEATGISNTTAQTIYGGIANSIVNGPDGKDSTIIDLSHSKITVNAKAGKATASRNVVKLGSYNKFNNSSASPEGGIAGSTFGGKAISSAKNTIKNNGTNNEITSTATASDVTADENELRIGHFDESLPDSGKGSDNIFEQVAIGGVALSYADPKTSSSTNDSSIKGQATAGNASAQNNVIDIYGDNNIFNGNGHATALINIETSLVGGYANSFARNNGDSAETRAKDATASDNAISIHGEKNTFSKEVIGGHAISEASSNISGAAINAFAGTASASNNTVTVFSEEGVAEGDRNHFKEDILGGLAETAGKNGKAIANKNAVNLTRSEVDGDIYGGHALTHETAETNGNDVALNETTVVGSIWGGFASSKDGSILAQSSTANGNVVEVSDSTVSTNIYGGQTKAENLAQTSRNRVDLVRTQVNTIWGGFAESTVLDGSSKAEADSNEVDLTDVKVSDVYGGRALTHATAQTSNNQVALTNTSVSGAVWGGFAGVDDRTLSGTAKKASSTGNAITLNQATIGSSVTGAIGSSAVYGGVAAAITPLANSTLVASKNTVDVANGSHVYGDVIGGRVAAENNTNDFEAKASENVIRISQDSLINGNVIGGQIVADGTTRERALATNNVVVLDGAHDDYDDLAHAALYGGRLDLSVSGSSTADVFSGNRLISRNFQGKVAKVANFEHVEIDASDLDLRDGTTIIEVTGDRVLGSEDGSKRSSVSIAPTVGRGSVLKAGDRVHLMTSGSGLNKGLNANNGQSVSLVKGSGVVYDARYVQNNGVGVDDVRSGVSGISWNEADDVDLLITKARASDQSTNVMTGKVAGLTMVSAGADLLLSEQLLGQHVFGAIQGGHSDYRTRNGLDVDAVNFVVGFNGQKVREGSTTQGGFFFEGGHGSIAAHDGSGHGTGNANYYGVGLLARHDVTQGSFAGLYVDASARVGRIHGDFSHSGVLDERGRRESLENHDVYWGLHGGVGYQFDVNDLWRLDSSARFFYTHVEGSHLNADAQRYALDAVKSKRLRVGSELRFLGEQRFNVPFVGLALDYEFDGKAKGTVEDLPMKSIDLSGATGILNVGVDSHPAGRDDLTLRFLLGGYVGEREGVTGEVRLTYVF